MGYTSAAGNTYYKAIRLSDRIAVFYDLGDGYSRTFLNGITLFAFDGAKPVIIAKKSWGGCCNYRFFNEYDAKRQSIIMLEEYLASQAKMLGENIPHDQICTFAQSVIDETHQRRIC